MLAAAAGLMRHLPCSLVASERLCKEYLPGGFSSGMFHTIKLIPWRVRLISDMKDLRAKLPLPSILGSIAGVDGMYPLRILSYYPLAHIIIHYNRSPVLDTVFIQLLTIVSRTLALPYTTYLLSNQHSIYNLSIIHKRGKKRKKRKKKLQQKRKSHKQEFRSREKLNDRMKTASYNLELLSAIKLSSPTNQCLRNFTSRNS